MQEGGATISTADKTGDWLKQMLAAMPESVASQTVSKTCVSGETLLRMADKAASVFFLLSGKVAGVNEQSGGLHFRYASFNAPMIFGEYEAFSDCVDYRSTLVCETTCKLLVLPRDVYIAWVKQDAAVLFARTRALAGQLMTQSRRERELLFLSGEDRLAAFFAASCSQSKPEAGEYALRFTLQQMADGIGCSVRTVQRSLDRLTERGIIRRQKRNILVRAEAMRGLSAGGNDFDEKGEC